MKTTILSLSLLLIAVICLTLSVLNVFRSDNELRIHEQCHEYERSGIIPQDSCDCTERIFTTWAESYDWKDACEIEQGGVR